MKPSPVATRPGRSGACSAFTLLEVMIAIGIFFMVAFAVLALVSQCLSQARSLQFSRTPIGAIASDALLKVPLEDGVYNGDFGDLYPDYRWEAEVYVPDFVTNETLKAVDLQVRRSGAVEPEAELVILKFQPDPPPQEQEGAFWQ